MGKGRLIWIAALGGLILLAAGPAMVTAAANTDQADGTVTFSRDVLPILQEKCQGCHRQNGDNYTGMVAPMSFTTYEEVRPWARAIARQVQARKMPPWFAAPEFHGVFSNERTLTEDQIATLVRWAKRGAPLGDPTEAPAERLFESTGGWRIGKPDLVVTAPRYFVPDDVDTHYINHTVTLTEDILPESRWIQAIEWKGGSSAVHHIVGYAYLPGQPHERGRGYGLGSIAPGEEPMSFPEGYAKLLVKGSSIVFSMHYHKEKGPGTGMWDESQVAFNFLPEDAQVSHFVDHGALSNHSFDIPPGHANWRVGAVRVFDVDTTILAMHPHMHLRGKDAEYVAYYPDGTSESLLRVPSWDFNWQTDYSFKEPKRLPAGTRLEYIAHFDNSRANPDNPDPEVPIDWGRETWDEMMLGYITYSATQAEDLTVSAVVADRLVRPSAPPAEE